MKLAQIKKLQTFTLLRNKLRCGTRLLLYSKSTKAPGSYGKLQHLQKVTK